MKRLVSSCSMFAVLALTAVPVGAQARSGVVGIGANIATSDYADVDSAKTGYQLMAGLDFPFLVSSTTLRIDGLLAWNARKTIFRESTYLAGINAHLLWWTPKVSSLRPYLLAGVGYLYHKYNSGQSPNSPRAHTEPVYSGGAGFECDLGPLTTFVEGRYDYGADLTRVYPVILGVRFGKARQ